MTEPVDLDVVIRYHLDAIRRFGRGWRAPQVRRHREAVIAVIRLRRAARRASRVPVSPQR